MFEKWWIELKRLYRKVYKHNKTDKITLTPTKTPIPTTTTHIPTPKL